MMNFIIEVRERNAEYVGNSYIVSGNSGYTVTFDTDSEWERYPTKTARFVINGRTFADVLFTGDTCEVPVLPKGLCVLVGLYAGDIQTTTAAKIKMVQSLANGTETVPPADVYNQLMELLNVDYTLVDRAESAAVISENASASILHVKNVVDRLEEATDKAKRYRDEAEQFDLSAGNSADASERFSQTSFASAQKAKSSETNAAESERKAKQSENAALESANNAEDSAIAAKQSEGNAYASETAAKVSELNAKSSEIHSKSSESSASQALADLLRMLGTDVATLVNGKIPVSQIPSIATVEIYHAASLEEMNALEVQRGDVCIRTDEDKSYIYIDGWVHLASPTDYASRSGYSDTSGVAENANTIGGHRLVQIPWSAWESAVKDPNTYYLVYTEETE